MSGSSVLSTFAVGAEPTNNRGRQTLLPLTVMTNPMSLTSQPAMYAATQGARLHLQVFGLSNGSNSVITITGLAPDGVTVVTENTPSFGIASANAAGVYEYCTKAVFGSVNANGITYTGTTLGNASMIAYGILSAKRLVAGKFVVVEDLPEFSPQDNRGLLDEDVRMAQLNKKVTWTLDSTLYPEEDQFFGNMAIAATTNPGTPVSQPGTPTSLLAATAFSSTPFSLTTQPKPPGQILNFVTSGNLVKGTLTVSGTNLAGEAISETISFPAGDSPQYSENVFASVNASGVTKTGMTAAATCTITGVFCYQPAFVPDQLQLLTFAGEHYDGVVGNVLPFMYATDWSLDYDVTKELKFSLKGEAQDYVPLGDRGVVDQTVNANPFSYTQPQDYPIVGWPGFFYVDPLSNSAGTTQAFNILTFKISGTTGMQSYMTSNGTQEWNQVGRKRRKTTFEATVDFVTLTNYEAFRAFQKRSYVAKFQAGQASPGGYIGTKSNGTLLYKFVQVTMYARQVKFAREGSDEKVIGKISGTCEYTMSQGLSFRLDFQNQNNPNYLL